MKNIFLVLNKEKIYAYIVSIFTIVTLFFMSYMLDMDFENIEDTGTNIEENKIENIV